jgi:beta-glucosidase
MSPATALIKESVEQRVNELLGQMTLEEKIGQMNQVSGLHEAQRDAIRNGMVGSLINATGAFAGKESSASANADVCNDCQRIAVTESRLGIPILFGRDVIHGYRTVFPIPLGQAATWDPALVEQAAAMAATEAAADGIKWTFSPMLDVARDPRWGRIAEGFGEDPYLTGAFAAATVRGYQGDDFADPSRVVACAKHYVGYGAAEGGRDYDRVDLSMRTLRDVYLPPFHAAVQAGAATVMSAFPDFGGVPVTANRMLLTDILRGEWGFAGFVVSDWNAVAELIVHGVAQDAADAAAKAIVAGVDMDMTSETYIHSLANLVRNGRVPGHVVDETVRRILRVKYLAGVFEYSYADGSRAGRVMLAPDHRATARRLAQESIVLLKNRDSILPLDGHFRRVAVVGPLAHAQGELFGTWTPDGRPEDVTSIADAIREAAPKDMKLVFASNLADDMLTRAGFADVAVVVVGEHQGRSGEAGSISNLDLPAGQRELIETIYANGIPIVLVTLAGRPLAITREADLAQAVLYAWHPGLEGGHAIADVLFGRVSPSGKLPVTIPRTVGQVPIYYAHKNTGRPPARAAFSSRYIDLPIGPLYPFGFGLSYTTFAYSNLRVSSPDFKTGTNEISVDITNTGSSAGTEIAQLYVRDLVGSITRPVKELKGFQRIILQPGETRQVSFSLGREDLGFTGMDDQMVVEPGEFHVWVGPNSAEGLQSGFRLIE